MILPRNNNMERCTKKNRVRKMLTMLITCMLLVSSMQTVAMAQEMEEKNISAYVNVSDRLNLREEPSTDSEILQKLMPGQMVSILTDETQEWVKVETADGTIGYVKMQYLSLPKNIDAKVGELISTAVITKSKSSANRNFNMARACEAINGLVLRPGEEFNWYGPNGVGQATKENGYKLSTVISNGKYVSGYGGGVCQVSTALFNCINKLGIVPTEHHHHSLESSYVEHGMDATVSYPGKNFVFTNTTNDSILFEAYANGASVTVNAYKVE